MSTSAPSLQKQQYIIRLKDHVDLETHIRILTDKYGDSHKVIYQFDKRLVNAYVGEFSDEVLRGLQTDSNVDCTIANAEVTEKNPIEMIVHDISYYHNCVIVKRDRPPQWPFPTPGPIIQPSPEIIMGPGPVQPPRSPPQPSPEIIMGPGPVRPPRNAPSAGRI